MSDDTNLFRPNGAHYNGVPAEKTFDLEKIDWPDEVRDWFITRKRRQLSGDIQWRGYSLYQHMEDKYQIVSDSDDWSAMCDAINKMDSEFGAMQTMHRTMQGEFDDFIPTTPDPADLQDEPLAGFAGSSAEGALRGEAPRKSRFRTRAQDRDAPPPTWIIAGLIEDNSDTAIYAPSGFLKSFVALDIAYAIATGTKALGTLPVISSGPVAYYCGEGYTDVIKRRGPAWELAHDRQPYSVDNIIFAREAPYLNDTAGLENDMSDLSEWLAGLPNNAVPIRLTIIDTLNRSLNGADEDRAHTASKYLNMAKMLRERLGGSTLTIAHKGKDLERGGRGSSAFEAGFDTVLDILHHTKHEDTDCHTIGILVKKQKSGEDGELFWLQTEHVNTPDGESLVLVPCSADDARHAFTDNKPNTRTVNDDMVETVLLGITDGGYVTTSRLVDVIHKRTNKTPEAIRKALDRGIKTGELVKFKAGYGQWALPEMIAMGENAEIVNQRGSATRNQRPIPTHTGG